LESFLECHSRGGGVTVEVEEAPQRTIMSVSEEKPTRKELSLQAARSSQYSGASIRSDHLVIATVQGGASCGFELCIERSAQIELEDRDGESLHQFRSDVEAFIREARIARLILRALPKTGKFRTGLGLKIEAVLQLIPGLQVDLVHFNVIDSWRRYSSEILPKPIAGLVHWEEEAHRYAIAAGCWAETRAASNKISENEEAGDELRPQMGRQDIPQVIP
jgi:hypothetical protein